MLQPFSPLLFKRVSPPGPHRLIRKLSGVLTTEAAMDEWRQDVEVIGNEVKDQGDPLKTEHLCTSCYFGGKKRFMYPAKMFLE